MSLLPSDFQGLADAVGQFRDSLRKFIYGTPTPATKDGFTEFVINLVTALYWMLSFLFATIVLLITIVGTQFASEVVSVIKSIRSDGASDFAALGASVMGEAFGFDIDPGNLSTGQGSGANAARANAIGTSFMSQLEKMLIPAGGVNPASGRQSAATLAGWLTVFAVGNNITSWIAELVSLDHFTGLKDIGEDVARNLGLGRIAHQAIAPLVRNVIAQQFDR